MFSFSKHQEEKIQIGNWWHCENKHIFYMHLITIWKQFSGRVPCGWWRGLLMQQKRVCGKRLRLCGKPIKEGNGSCPWEVGVSPNKDFRSCRISLIVESYVWGQAGGIHYQKSSSQTFNSHKYWRWHTGEMCNGCLADTDRINNVLCFDKKYC